METTHSAPCRGDEEIHGTVPVDVADGNGIEAEGVARSAAGERLHQRAVFS